MKSNRLLHRPAFTELSRDRETLDVTENLRRQLDAEREENQRLNAQWRSISAFDILAAVAVFAAGLFSGLRIQDWR